MPIYSYKAFDAAGNPVDGVIDADSAAGARARLAEQGLFPHEVQEGISSSAAPLEIFGRVSAREVTAFTRQLATLVGAGFSISEALSTLSEQIQNLRFKQIVVGMRDRIGEGKSLSDAVKEYPQVFPDIFPPMMRAGERAGRLPMILNQLANYQSRQQHLRGKVTAAIAYPSVMFAMSVAIVIFLMTWVIPNLVETFQKEERVLPWITRVLIAISDFLRDGWLFLIIGGVGLLAAVRSWIRTEGGREQWDRLRLWAPVIGPLYRQILIARFLRTFGVLVRSDVAILQTIEILRGIVQNVIVARELSAVAEAISKGSSIALPLRASGIFPPIVTAMINAGQKSGQLDELLLKAAEEYESEVENSLLMFTAVLEPIIIIVMGLIVGFIVLAIVLPLLELSQSQT